jgi:pimeloyl-ACP methyl ester carboxylesterase
VPLRHLLPVAILPFILSGPVVVRSARPSALRACEVAGIAGGGRCGSIEVFENRAARAGRRIALNVVVVPATEPDPAPDPVFWLEGGPGGAATGAIGPVSQQYLRGLRRSRDLVFVDQRGTGRSNPLNCDDIGDSPADPDRYFGKLFPRELIRACRQKLEPIADLRQYTTSIAMDDLDDVRASLGYSTVNLAGASYGTQAALIYIRRHREHVRSAFLVGVAPPDFKLPLPFARAAQHALDLTFADCAADRACHAAFPDIVREFGAVLARFDGGPLRITIADPATKAPRTVTLERESYVEHLRLLLYNTFGARQVPAVVHQAYLDNFLPFQAAAAREAGAGLSRGMYFSITCSEDVPFITDLQIVEETRSTFLGDRRIRAHQAACGDWPRAEVAREFLDPVTSDVPTILYSGEADGATPEWIAAAALRSLSNGRQIHVPHTGHQIAGQCAWDLMRDFITHPSTRELDASCVAGIKRPPFVLEVR